MDCTHVNLLQCVAGVGGRCISLRCDNDICDTCSKVKEHTSGPESPCTPGGPADPLPPYESKQTISTKLPTYSMQLKRFRTRDTLLNEIFATHKLRY